MNKRPLTENEKLALEYIRQNPGHTPEDVINFLCPYLEETALRSEISNAVWHLIYNDYVDYSLQTGAMKFRTASGEIH